RRERFPSPLRIQAESAVGTIRAPAGVRRVKPTAGMPIFGKRPVSSGPTDRFGSVSAGQMSESDRPQADLRERREPASFGHSLSTQKCPENSLSTTRTG